MKKITLTVPRQHEELFADILNLNGFMVEVDKADGRPSILHVDLVDEQAVVEAKPLLRAAVC